MAKPTLENETITTSIMQPYIFPYLGYFQLISQSSIFISLDDVNFIKKGWINRNRIIANNKEWIFSIPISSVSQNRAINKHFIVQDCKWKYSFLNTVKHSYSKSPNFAEVYVLIEECLNFEDLNCARFVENALLKCCHYLNINTPIIKSSELDISSSLTSEDRIMQLCKKVNTDTYINPIGGSKLYDKASFTKNQISLKFIECDLKFTYPQNSNQFISGLSIIDLLMNLSKRKLNNLINHEYTLY